MDEKRKFERFNIQLKAHIISSEEDCPGDRFVLTSNISSGGAYLPTDNPFPAGTPVRVEFTLPLSNSGEPWTEDSIIISTGVIVRNDAYGMAVSFEKCRICSLLKLEKESNILP
jgi:hypothetical protein